MQWRWYHGLIFVVSIEATASFLTKIARKTRNLPPGEPPEVFDNPGAEYEAVYNGLKQPRFAPPGWVFFPIWQINNALATWGLLQVLNRPSGTAGRREFLGAHSVFWLTYATFTAAYFGQRSPLKGALLTDVGLLAALWAAAIALFRLKDPKVAFSFVTLVPWLLLAAPVSTLAAAWNRDEFFNREPLFEAPEKWVKPGTGTK